MIELPRACVVDKFIPKKTFYEKVNISNSIKEEFTDKLSRIYWRYKIPEDTINISKIVHFLYYFDNERFFLSNET